MKTIDAETVIVNLLKEDRKCFLSIDRLQMLYEYIYQELVIKDLINSYNIIFDINFYSIERTVLCNNNIFKLDIDGDYIYLRDIDSVDYLTSQHKADDTLKGIISSFCKIYAA